MFTVARWICPACDPGDAAPDFSRTFSLNGSAEKAVLRVTAMGVYEAHLNGQRVGDFILAPGWTAYHKRLQVQEYDVTPLLKEQNILRITVGKGWYRSPMGWNDTIRQGLGQHPCGLIAELTLTYPDGRKEVIATDESWGVQESCVRFSEIYDGEIYDASFTPDQAAPARCFDGPTHTLIPQEGEAVREQERIAPVSIFRTPKGETVVDFGQNLTGYVVTTLEAQVGDEVDLSFAEVLDKDGNFYTDNYRTAKAQYRYLCRDGKQTYRPRLTFWGFRYVRVNRFPGEVTRANFTAVAVHSDMKRTGFLRCSHPLLNRLFDNIVWGQKGNFVDIPTDCPQRDERLGWTGDAQVFARTACLNYDAERFFRKWLRDLAADQHEDGYVGHVIPDILHAPKASAAWGDAAVICPWEVYLAYGNADVLREQFASMRRWVDYITATTKDEFLWTGGEHYEDWLGLDAPSGSYKGSTRADFIATAFYAHSASLVAKAARVLGEDASAYEALHGNIVQAFRRTFTEYKTQTECVLAAHFGLAEDPQAAADQLAQMVKDAGVQLRTGFVGTPYLLHVLSHFGHTELAYSLLLRTEYPSWLYPVTKGATTVWEHWDGTMPDGSFWSANMNSYNHYAYGSVADWVYGVAAGIRTDESAPGYGRVIIAPKPDARLEWLKAQVHTRHGLVSSAWRRQDGAWRYEVETPVEAQITIAGETRVVPAGRYVFYE